MKPSKKEIEEAKAAAKKAEKKDTKKEPIIQGPTLRDIDEIWNVIDEMQNIQLVSSNLLK